MSLCDSCKHVNLEFNEYPCSSCREFSCYEGDHIEVHMKSLCDACKFQNSTMCKVCEEFDVWEYDPAMAPLVQRVVADERNRCLECCNRAIERTVNDKWGKDHLVYTKGTIEEVIEDIKAGR